MKKYWIEYIGGERKVFEAENEKDARWYFMMEGDHAYDFGEIKEDEQDK